MARTKQTNPFPDVADAPTDGFREPAAVATAEAPPVNGNSAPEETPQRKRRRRDANAVRPVYFICGVRRDGTSLDILLQKETIGRARKSLDDARQFAGRDYTSFVIFRAKAVS